MTWKAAGINRIIIGVQTLNNKTRNLTGRNLRTEEVLSRIELASKFFQNLGIDLIANLPGDNILQTLDILRPKFDLIKHVSLYDLETDNDSVIGKSPQKYHLPKEHEAAETLASAWTLLEQNGYEHYEISNFAINGEYCKHNYDFWKGDDYLGFGLGASSRLENRLITNTSGFESYLAGSCKKRVTKLSPIEANRLDLSLLMRTKLPLNQRLELLHHGKLDKKYQKAGFIDHDWRMTDKGMMVYNELVNELIDEENFQ